jgi:hypothetical protein
MQTLLRLHKRLLGNILRIGHVSGQAIRQAIDERMMLDDQTAHVDRRTGDAFAWPAACTLCGLWLVTHRPHPASSGIEPVSCHDIPEKPSGIFPEAFSPPSKRIKMSDSRSTFDAGRSFQPELARLAAFSEN